MGSIFMVFLPEVFIQHGGYYPRLVINSSGWYQSPRGMPHSVHPGFLIGGSKFRWTFIEPPASLKAQGTPREKLLKAGWTAFKKIVPPCRGALYLYLWYWYPFQGPSHHPAKQSRQGLGRLSVRGSPRGRKYSSLASSEP